MGRSAGDRLFHSVRTFVPGELGRKMEVVLVRKSPIMEKRDESSMRQHRYTIRMGPLRKRHGWQDMHVRTYLCKRYLAGSTAGLADRYLFLVANEKTREPDI